jgi:dihydrofolate reductase
MADTIADPIGTFAGLPTASIGRDGRHTEERVRKQSPRRTSMAVRVDLNISLDGFATTTDQTPENPFGPDWARLTEAYTATRTFRARVLQDTSGEGTTGVDDRYAQAYFAELGAEIMGAGMFGLHQFADDPDWRGWWGDEPPFHVPVFVLTHSPRPVLEMAGGTTFQFLAATPREALDLALEAAGGRDVRIGGGPTVVREFLKGRLVDRLHVAIVPILLGRGIRLWDDLRGLEDGYDVTSEVAPSGITHLTFSR